MDSGRTETVMEANIVAVCEYEPSIVAAFLFGSYAKGKEKPSSD
jgi:predicted nucleotidyltransferase